MREIKFIPNSLYLSDFGKEDESSKVYGELENNGNIIGESQIILTEEESELVRTALRKASIRQNKIINNK